MWSKGAIVAALALAAAPQGDAFFHPNAAVVRGPTLRPGALSCPVSRPARASSAVAPQMSDLSDMTLEMLKRVEKSLGDLDDIQLARFQGVCQQVADKAHALRGPDAVGPPTKVDYGNKSFEEIEAENDAYFGLDDDTQLEDVRPPPRAAAPSAPAPTPTPTPAAPAPTPVPAPAPARPGSVDRDGRSTSALSRVQTSDNQAPPIVEKKGGRVFSKYLPPQEETQILKKATVESFVSEDEWTAAYIKEFGAPPPEAPMIDDETPRPAGNPEDDSFHEVRKVQAAAGDYPTSEAYYDALNDAIARWRNNRQESGGLVGSVVSDRYMDQLASMKPFDAGEGNKFSLGCLLVERKGSDDEGNERGVLVTTQVDPPGTLGIAGVQKGDAVLAINGQDIESYADLKEAMAKIHAVGKMTVQVVIQRQAVGSPELLTVTS